MGISPPIQFATIGMGDSLVLMVIALVVLGPRRLPQVGRQIGKLMYEFRKASNDFKYQMEEELRSAEEADRRKREEAERQRILAETQSAIAKAQRAADTALNAAAQAQSAAQAAQNAGSQVSASGSEEPGPVAETKPVEPGLRVQPPATGEQIPATRPGRAGKAPAVESAEQTAAPEQEIPVKKEVAAENGSAATESAAHHA